MREYIGRPLQYIKVYEDYSKEIHVHVEIMTEGDTRKDTRVSKVFIMKKLKGLYIKDFCTIDESNEKHSNLKLIKKVVSVPKEVPITPPDISHVTHGDMMSLIHDGPFNFSRERVDIFKNCNCYKECPRKIDNECKCGFFSHIDVDKNEHTLECFLITFRLHNFKNFEGADMRIKMTRLFYTCYFRYDCHRLYDDFDQLLYKNPNNRDIIRSYRNGYAFTEGNKNIVMNRRDYFRHVIRPRINLMKTILDDVFNSEENNFYNRDLMKLYIDDFFESLGGLEESDDGYHKKMKDSLCEMRKTNARMRKIMVDNSLGRFKQ